MASLAVVDFVTCIGLVCVSFQAVRLSSCL